MKGLGTSIKNFVKTHPTVLALAAVVGAMYALSKATDAWTESIEEQKESLKEYQEAIKEYEDQIDSLESKLEENKGKIEELNSNPIDIVDQNTLSTLKKENTELTQQLETVKALNEEAKSLSRQKVIGILGNTAETTNFNEIVEGVKDLDFDRVIDAYIGESGIYEGVGEGIDELKEGKFISGIVDIGKSIVSNGSPIENLHDALSVKKENELSILEEVSKQLDKDEELRKELRNVKNRRQDYSSDEEHSKKQQEITNDINKNSTSLVENIKLLQQYKDILSGTDDPVELAWIKKIEELQDDYTAAMTNREEYNTFDEIMNSDAYGSSKEELIELAEQGALTEDILNEKYHNLYVLFDALGLSVDDVIEKLKTMRAEGTDAYTGSAVSFSDIFSLETASGNATALSNLKDNLNEITSSYQNLKTAMDEINTTGAVSFSTLEKLIESGDDWVNYLTLENGQLKINEDSYYAMAQAKLHDLKIQSLRNLSDEVLKIQDLTSANDWLATQNVETADSYDTLAESIKNSTLAQLRSKLALADSTAEKKAIQNVIDTYSAQFDKITHLYDNVDISSMLSGSASTIADSLSKIKDTADLISTVSDELSESGNISVSTLQKIASEYPVLEQYVIDYIEGVEGSEENLKDRLNELYQEDLKNYRECYKLKANDSEDFWDSYVNQVADDINTMAANYGIDLSNYQNYAKVLEDINNKIIESYTAVTKAKIIALTTGDVEKSAVVAGLTTDQKRVVNSSIDDIVKEWFKTDKEGKLVGLKAKIGDRAGVASAVNTIAETLMKNGFSNEGLSQSTAQAIFSVLYSTQNSNLENLKTSLMEDFDSYTSQQTEKVTSALSDPSKVSGSSSSSKDTTETFDWIEIKIKRLTEALDTLKTTADNVYKTWGDRNIALEQAIADTTNVINNQVLAEQKYLEKANSVGLSESYKKLVRDGAIDIDDIKDESLQEKIKEYQEWYNKSVEAKQAQEELNAELDELKTKRFDNLVTQYDDIIGKMTTEKELLESQITLLSSAGDYDTLRNKQSNIVSGLKDELSRLNTEFANTGIKYGTEQWYDYKEQIADVEQKIIDAENELKSIDNMEFDNLKEAFDFELSVFENGMQSIQSKIDALELKGLFVNDSYYQGMKEYTMEQLGILQEERNQLQEILNSTLHKQGTTEWNDMYSTLMDVDLEIESMTNNLLEYDNAMRDLDWEVFKYLEDALSRITDETEFLTELLAKKDLFDKDTGKLTDNADATIALHAVNYDVYKQQAQDYYGEMQELQKQLVDGAGKDVLEYFNMIVGLHQDSILSMEQEKEAILDLVSESYNAQLEALEKIIDKKKEQLNAEKSIYDYQKNIKQHTNEISSLEKQKLAYEGDDSEGAITKIQQIDVQLKEAREQLKETEMDKALSETQQMLDKITEDMELWISARLDNEDLLLSEIVGKVEEKGNAIYTTLESIASTYGTTLSDSLNTIFGSDTQFSTSLSSIGENVTNGFNNVLGTETGEGLAGIESSLETGLGGVSTSVSSVATAIKNLMDEITSLVTDDSKNATGTVKPSTNTDTSKKDTTPTNNVTDKVTVPTVPTTPPKTNTSTQSSGNSSANKSTSNAKDYSGIFEHKKYTYPSKAELERTCRTSIVDALKLYDYDASFKARKKYYNALIDGSAYTGSAKQNVALLKKFREIQGFHTGGIVGELKTIIGKNGDDSLSINTLEKGEGIIPKDRMAQWDKLIQNLEPLNASVDLFKNVRIAPVIPDGSTRNSVINNDIKMDISLPDVRTPDDFIDAFQTNKRFEQLIGSMTGDMMKPGLNNSLNKYRY